MRSVCQRSGLSVSRLVLLQSVVFCFVLHTAERDSSAGERGHRAGQSAGSKRETHTHTPMHQCSQGSFYLLAL